MKSICFVGLDNYPVLNPQGNEKYFGGESVQQTLLAKEFARRGFDVSMVVLDTGIEDGHRVDGVRVLKTYPPRAGLPIVRFLHPRMSKVLGALARADADVYYQSCAGMLTGLVAHFCRGDDRQMIYRVAHDTDCLPGQQLIRYWRDRKIYEYGLRRANRLVAQGVRQQEMLKANYGLDSVVINMVVEEPAERLDQNRDIDILWVNNMRQFKRPELLVELASRVPNRKFAMIGGPVPGEESYYESIREAASRVSNLDFLGPVPYQQVNQYFARARLFVNTSESEGFPNSYLQAWIRAVPVVAFFDPDGLIATHDLGLCPAEIGSMADQVDELLGDTARLNKLGANAREYANRFYAAPAVVDRYLEVLGADTGPTA